MSFSFFNINLKEANSGFILFFLISIILLFYTATQFYVYTDDFFITFRYANNLATGKGFVYNEDERILATTTPLLTLILAWLRLLGFQPEQASSWVCAIALFGTAFLLYQLHRHRGEEIAGFSAGLFLFFIPPLMQLWGNEIPLCLFFIIAAIYYLERSEADMSAAFQGLYALTRGEGLLFALYLQLLDTWRNKRINFRAIAILVAVIAPWYIFAKLYFGDFLPYTFKAKMTQGIRGDMFNSYQWGLILNLQNLFFSPNLIVRVLTWLGCIKLISNSLQLFKHSKDNRTNLDVLLLCWIIIHQLSYLLLVVPGIYQWYYYTIWFLYPILPAYGISLLFPLKKRLITELSYKEWLLFAVVTIAVFIHYFSQPHYNTDYKIRYEIYKQVSYDIRREIRPVNPTILVHEIGILGYYLPEYRFRDIAGLLVKNLSVDMLFNVDYFLRRLHPEIFIDTFYIQKPGEPKRLPRTMVVRTSYDRRIIYKCVKEYRTKKFIVRIWKRARG